MQKSYECELATHVGPESCGVTRKGGVEALTEERAGRVSATTELPLNQPALFLFRFQVGRLWHRALSRRSQKGRVRWDRMRRLIHRWLPPPAICHPYPLRRMGVVT